MVGRAAGCFAVVLAAFLGVRVADAQPPRVALVDEDLPTVNMTLERHAYWASLLQEFAALGYTEGDTLAVERWSLSDGAYPDRASLARAVVDSAPDAAIVRGYPLVEALQATMSTTPVIGVGEFPTDETGAAIAPGGSITGFNELDRTTHYAKQLQILRDAAPAAKRIAYLGPADHWDDQRGELLRAAAARLELEIQPVLVRRPVGAPSLIRAAAAITPETFDAILVSEDAEIGRHRRLVVDVTEGKDLPTIAYHPDYAEFGTLFAYSANVLDLYRRAARYAERIFNGATPAELPLGQPETFNFVMNFVTADRIGVTFPPHLIDEATEYWK